MYSYKPLLKRKSLGCRYENAAVDEIRAIQGHSFLCNFMIAEFLSPLLSPYKNKPQLLWTFRSATEDKYNIFINFKAL